MKSKQIEKEANTMPMFIRDSNGKMASPAIRVNNSKINDNVNKPHQVFNKISQRNRTEDFRNYN
jgi:hypothetical protein